MARHRQARSEAYARNQAQGTYAAAPATLFGREKCARLPRAISEGGEYQRSYQAGDMVYWPPGPDVAFFYRHDGQSIPAPGIVVLGHIDAGLETLARHDGPVEIASLDD